MSACNVVTADHLLSDPTPNWSDTDQSSPLWPCSKSSWHWSSDLWPAANWSDTDHPLSDPTPNWSDTDQSSLLWPYPTTNHLLSDLIPNCCNTDDHSICGTNLSIAGILVWSNATTTNYIPFPTYPIWSNANQTCPFGTMLPHSLQLAQFGAMPTIPLQLAQFGPMSTIRSLTCPVRYNANYIPSSTYPVWYNANHTTLWLVQFWSPSSFYISGLINSAQ